MGIAMDGYPIYGPGINPSTGQVWSQNDMDACGGQEIEGKYAYYVTGILVKIIKLENLHYIKNTIKLISNFS